MEQTRLFLAIGLSILVFVVWTSFQPKPEIVENTKEEVITTKIDEKNEKSENVINEKEQTVELSKDLEVKEVVKNIEIKTIKTPLYQIKISNRGAIFKSIKLNNFKEKNEENSKLKELLSEDLNKGIYDISFENEIIEIDKNTFFDCDNYNNTIEIKDRKTNITYKTVSKNGVTLEKIFKFDPEKYLIEMDVVITNGTEKSIKEKIAVTIINEIKEKSSFAFQGPSVFTNKKLEQIKIDKIKDGNNFSGIIDWISIEDRYFMTGIINSNNEKSEAVIKLINKDKQIVESKLIKNIEKIKSGAKTTLNFKIYSGPKKLSSLKKIGHDIDKIVNFGWFDIIAKPCLLLMNIIHDKLFSNYGIAIIILTIIFKIIFWPLGTKSYKSMNDMKKLQPLVAELKEKYKDDKQKMNQEMMGLYKTYKVNPLSGCLPMVVQMPIFFAFYKMLYSAIELRHAPFFGWIMDLSAPDRLGNFPFTIPLFDAPTGIPVLTLLMGASMFLQQKMSPPAGDPAQAKMMMMMPIFMTFIFMNFSSGLVLYWLVNNIISISQQYYVMKRNA